MITQGGRRRIGGAPARAAAPATTSTAEWQQPSRAPNQPTGCSGGEKRWEKNTVQCWSGPLIRTRAGSRVPRPGVQGGRGCRGFELGVAAQTELRACWPSQGQLPLSCSREVQTAMPLAAAPVAVVAAPAGVAPAAGGSRLALQAPKRAGGARTVIVQRAGAASSMPGDSSVHTIAGATHTGTQGECTQLWGHLPCPGG